MWGTRQPASRRSRHALSLMRWCELVVVVTLLGNAAASISVEPLPFWLSTTGLIAVALVLVEVSMRSTRGAQHEVEQRVRQQAAIAKLGERAIESRDLQPLLDAAVRLVRDTIGVDFCKVLELDRSGRSLRMRAGVGWTPGSVGRARVGAHRESQAGYTLLQATPVVVEDFAREQRFSAADLLVEHGVQSGISCTIPGGPGRPWGVLGAHSRVPRCFDEDDIHFMVAVAHVLSAALVREGLEKRIRRGEKLEAVGQLAGGVAHDFNNLLTVISGYAEQLEEKCEGDEQLAVASREISRAADRAAALTRRLLAFSRRKRPEIRPVEVAPLIRSLEPTLRSLCGENVELRLELREPSSPVLADATDVEQVLLNLVLNARDAMLRGGRLWIRLRELAREERSGATSPAGPARWLRLVVEDNGIGMDPTTRRRAFEPFFTTKDAGRGTGLGLASVSNIVNQLAGEIRLESDIGRGSRFEIDLPCTERTEDALACKALPKPRARPTETVLLVEDDDEVRALSHSALERTGYRVLVAAGAREALALAAAEAGTIHLLVSDIVMPGMDGIELSLRLREELPDVGILLCSGYDERLSRDPAALPKGACLLAKPFTPSVLLAEVRAALLRVEARDAGACPGVSPLSAPRPAAPGSRSSE